MDPKLIEDAIAADESDNLEQADEAITAERLNMRLLANALIDFCEPLSDTSLVPAALATALGHYIGEIANDKQNLYRGIQLHAALVKSRAMSAFAERQQDAADDRSPEPPIVH